MATAAPVTNKRWLSRTLAEWSTSLRYEDLSPEAIRAAMLYWFDSMGCALGGSRQEDAEMLLAHHREMAGSAEGCGRCTCFVSASGRIRSMPRS
jgi:2-methylcitrate dehydratase PrpD